MKIISEQSIARAIAKHHQLLDSNSNIHRKIAKEYKHRVKAKEKLPKIITVKSKAEFNQLVGLARRYSQKAKEKLPKHIKSKKAKQKIREKYSKELEKIRKKGFGTIFNALKDEYKFKRKIEISQETAQETVLLSKIKELEKKLTELTELVDELTKLIKKYRSRGILR